jgi:hypothetical protein
MITIAPNPALSITTPTPEFEVEVLLSPRIITPGSSTEVTIDDAVFDRQTSATAQNDGVVVVSGDISPGESTATIQYAAENGLVTVASDGTFTSQASSGTASIIVSVPFARKRVTFAAGQVSETVDVYDRYANGTLGELLFDDVTAALAGYASGSAVFTSRDDANAVYTRATNFAGLDLSGWSVWSSSHGAARTVTAITRRHVLMADHFMPSNGATIRFVALDGTVVTRTLTARTQVSGLDVNIGTLDSDLPESIRSYTVLPQNWEHNITRLYNVPVLYTKANLIYPRTWTTSASMSPPNDIYFPTVTSIRSVEWAAITQNVTSGDSGMPIFTILDGEPVLLAANWLQVNTTSAQAIGLNGDVVPLVNAIIAPYTLSTYDLSGFTDYYP